jgi:hypothetical protein
MKAIDNIDIVEYQEAQRELFASGKLWREWIAQYPDIFDEDDCRLAQNQAHLHHHFFEWRAAIWLYEKKGYLSLVEKYQFNNHKRKQSIFLPRISSNLELVNLIAHPKDHGRVQCPDLFVYKPDSPTDWFFCEVKGGADRVRDEQASYFEMLFNACHKPVRLIQFRTATQ